MRAWVEFKHAVRYVNRRNPVVLKVLVLAVLVAVGGIYFGVLGVVGTFDIYDTERASTVLMNLMLGMIFLVIAIFLLNYVRDEIRRMLL